MKSLLFLLGVLAAPAANPGLSPGMWKACSIDSVAECRSDACSGRKPTISIFISDYMDRGTERSAYYRCGLQLAKCDRYRAVVYRTGDFTIFSVPERSVFAKLGPDDRITDVAALGDVVFVSRGKCADRAPPAESTLRSR